MLKLPTALVLLLAAACLSVLSVVLVFTTTAQAAQPFCEEVSEEGHLRLGCEGAPDAGAIESVRLYQDNEPDDSYAPSDPVPTGDGDSSTDSDDDPGASDSDDGIADEEFDEDDPGRSRDSKPGSVGDGDGGGLSNLQLALAMLGTTIVGAGFFTAARRTQRAGLDL